MIFKRRDKGPHPLAVLNLANQKGKVYFTKQNRGICSETGWLVRVAFTLISGTLDMKYVGNAKK